MQPEEEDVSRVEGQEDQVEAGVAEAAHKATETKMEIAEVPGGFFALKLGLISSSLEII